MRCPKCGYISFDHLANCRKCSRDLGDAREALNLTDFEPQVPFLLGSLVGEMQGGGAAYQQELSLTQETELEFDGLDMPETEAMEETVDMESMRETLDSDSSEEMKLSEIELDSLETLEASDGLDVGATEELQLSDFAEPSSEDVSSAEEDDEFLGLEFELDETIVDDLGTIEEDVAAEPPADEVLELDLNEHDLSELAKELEEQLEAETGDKKKAVTDDPSAGAKEMTLQMEDD